MKTILLLFMLVNSFLIQAQSYTHLVIDRGEGMESEINYPPGTEFFLFNEANDMVLSNDNLKEPYAINGLHTLLVTPNYKEGTDKYRMDSGRIYLKTVEYDNKVKPYSENRKGIEITAKKEYFEAKDPDKKNILVIFNTGLVFRYFDGVARAWYDNEEVDVRGRYLVDTPEGTAKISYNPQNGELWWVFDRSERK
ncbi:hypothetical protein [Croceiramulus getboli]|nr:hypothetical protein P8624_08950 [Flavobacteriaceae bacterium YJPT1-3]